MQAAVMRACRNGVTDLADGNSSQRIHQIANKYHIETSCSPNMPHLKPKDGLPTGAKEFIGRVIVRLICWKLACANEPSDARTARADRRSESKNEQNSRKVEGEFESK